MSTCTTTGVPVKFCTCVACQKPEVHNGSSVKAPACECRWRAGKQIELCVLHWRAFELIERAVPHMAHDANWQKLAAEQPRASEFPFE
jgi:hypothetical protein